ncbi:MAG: helix-turn-helix domain-containing protein [Deltaproteobacteria bacterium]|nr:helix-turn-helix domain-containing protein [Deltaproteobacteria bacterium]
MTSANTARKSRPEKNHRRLTGRQSQQRGAQPSVSVVALASDELERIIRDAVLDAMVDVRGSGEQDGVRRALLSKRQLATTLSCSTSTIDRLCTKGLPFVKLLDTKRFVLEDVLAWLKEGDENE